jgi:hypothetical protein
MRSMNPKMFAGHSLRAGFVTSALVTRVMGFCNRQASSAAATLKHQAQNIGVPIL